MKADNNFKLNRLKKRRNNSTSVFNLENQDLKRIETQIIKSQKQIDEYIKLPSTELMKLNKNTEIQSKVEIPFTNEYKD